MNWPLFQPLDLRNYLRICREFVWPFRYRLGGITLLASILVSLTLAQPIFTRIFLDNVIGQRDFDLFIKLVVVMGTAIVLMIALDFYINYIVCRTSTKINFTLRTRLYDHVLALPLDFHKSIDPGQLAYRILQDTSVIETAVSQLLINFFLNFLKAVTIGAYILYTDVWISIVVFIAIFGQIILVEKFRDPIYKLSLANKSAGEWLNAKLVKALVSIEFVKIMSGEKTEYAQFFKGAHRQAALSIRYIITGKAANLASAFLSNIWSFVLLSYGTHLVLTGRLTIGALVSYLMIAGMLYSPIESLVKMVLGFQDVRASIVRFLEVYSAPIEASGPTRISFLESPKNGRDISFEKVTFSYNSGPPVLSDVSFNIESGQTVAVMGANGAGKTTLCHLISRLYEPTSGRILIDGIDIRDYGLRDLRRIIGIVPQKSHLIDGTVELNICYGTTGRVNHSGRIQQAVRTAGALFIENLPDRYRTVVGKQGVSLSGGEAQLIAIARILYRDPSILLLDEASSFLDENSEQVLKMTLHNFLRNRTVFIISHKLNLIEKTDSVLRVNQSRVES